MLPRPVIEYIPVWYERDAKLTALAGKIDEVMNDSETEVLNLNHFFDPVRIPAQYLDELAFLLAVTINQADTERQKRQKIANAVEGHKRRGSWSLDVKIKIDTIVGANSMIVQSVDPGDWILFGDGVQDPGVYWSTLGVDGIDDSLGLGLGGSGPEVAGIVFIDVDDDSLTADQVDQLVLELDDSLPAYFEVHLGYIDGTGQFQDYVVIG